MGQNQERLILTGITHLSHLKFEHSWQASEAKIAFSASFKDCDEIGSQGENSLWEQFYQLVRGNQSPIAVPPWRWKYPSREIVTILAHRKIDAFIIDWPTSYLDLSLPCAGCGKFNCKRWIDPGLFLDLEDIDLFGSKGLCFECWKQPFDVMMSKIAPPSSWERLGDIEGLEE